MLKCLWKQNQELPRRGQDISRVGGPAPSGFETEQEDARQCDTLAGTDKRVSDPERGARKWARALAARAGFAARWPGGRGRRVFSISDARGADQPRGQSERGPASCHTRKPEPDTAPTDT